MADAFLMYVSRDKTFAQELSEMLANRNVQTADNMLALGDSLLHSFEQGLKDSPYGIVVLSKAFFRTDWPQFELDGLGTIDREYEGGTQLLPVWHEVSQRDIALYSRSLANRVGVHSDEGLEVVVEEIAAVVVPAGRGAQPRGGQEAYVYVESTRKVGAQVSELSTLRDQIVTYFNQGELRNLCFDLGVDYDDIPGETKSGKARELIGYMQRRGRLDELVLLLRQRRPGVEW